MTGVGPEANSGWRRGEERRGYNEGIQAAVKMTED